LGQIKITVQILKEHLLVKCNVVKTYPSGGLPTVNLSADFLGEFKG